jgi:hypothetical protein
MPLTMSCWLSNRSLNQQLKEKVRFEEKPMCKSLQFISTKLRNYCGKSGQLYILCRVVGLRP